MLTYLSNLCSSPLSYSIGLYERIRLFVEMKLCVGTQRIDRRNYEVTYSVGHQLYKMHVKPVNNPLDFTVYDQDSNNVTDRVLQYWGPERNWHHQVVTPQSLGYTELRFDNGATLHIFRESEPIAI